MSEQDRAHWDNIYRGRYEEPYPAPDPLLFPFIPPADRVPEPLRTALDLACGFGQNGLWLADQGYTVDLIDISRPALLRAQNEADQREIRTVNFIQMDLDSAGLEREGYGLVCVFRFLNRDLLAAVRAAVKPGGRIVYETYNTRQAKARPDANRDYLLKPGELTGTFSDWRILHNREVGVTSQIVAVKPDRRA